MRKKGREGGGEAWGGDRGWDAQMGGEEAGRRPPGRGRDPRWEREQSQKAVWVFFKATDLIS